MCASLLGAAGRLMAVLVLVSLAGCVDADKSARQKSEELDARKLAYRDEPYSVRLVDRTKFAKQLQPAEVPAPVHEPPGTIVIYTRDRLLYLIGENGRARRYGVAVGASGFAWSGQAVIGRKAKWPAWYPTDDMRSSSPYLPQRIEPGPHNPLGARALYLYKNGGDTLYRIHGTSEPWTIGTASSSGCIRMINEDVIDLFDRVTIGSKVVVR
ncbi:L,D-transpeptidase [Ciceribacter sp. RN22]|uniref:L,D-transpeptidase n=1 Tax=Ciceribacter sp. RN22 TaxID=2954932 RepID=UPI002092F08F|nr:L,D-transpeptidase [Ciceribacter sp. RN22]MCO6180792.1 L,D-transpeptidase [Ciceribacter sp. RN22]